MKYIGLPRPSYPLGNSIERVKVGKLQAPFCRASLEAIVMAKIRALPEAKVLAEWIFIKSGAFW